MNEKILIADDEKGLVDMLKSYFEMHAYRVYTAYSGEEALKQAACGPDLVLLDINMPGMDGLTVCEQIRDHISCPILFLSARIETSDKIKGFGAGADDYIVKPFDIDELGARAAAHLRRQNRRQESSILRFFSDMVIDYSRREVSIGGTAIPLSRKEFDITELLSLNAGQVFDRERIYDIVWGLEGGGSSDTIMEHIRKIRSKFAAVSSHSYIETVWGWDIDGTDKTDEFKKSLFVITTVHLLLALLLSAGSFYLCIKLGSAAAPQQSVILNGISSEITITNPPAPSAQAFKTSEIFSLLQILLPVLIFTAALLSTVSLFYRLKLEQPLNILIQSAERIMNYDLDFTVASGTADELGQLCAAFETMRQSLLENNQKLWKQAEERKRLNAAFSHDLRNPLTVLKGSAKMARQCIRPEDTAAVPLLEHLNRMEQYVGRIERYVETMNGIQRLEQLQIRKSPVDWCVFVGELERGLRFMAEDYGRRIVFSWAEPAAGAHKEDILLDTQVLFQIAENLVSNALRFAVDVVSVGISVSEGQMMLEVTDDGSGFPEELLVNGVQPFQKYDEAGGHFGMGLYICRMLCRKHGGELRIWNTDDGAACCAVLKISET